MFSRSRNIDVSQQVVPGGAAKREAPLAHSHSNKHMLEQSAIETNKRLTQINRKRLHSKTQPCPATTISKSIPLQFMCRRTNPDDGKTSKDPNPVQYRCNECSELKPKCHFSGKMLHKTNRHRRCIECTNRCRNAALQEADQFLCDECKEYKGKHCFSRKMRKKNQKKRHCIDCTSNSFSRPIPRPIYKHKYLCNECSERKSKHNFSRKMLKKNVVQRRCINCTNNVWLDTDELNVDQTSSCNHHSI